MENIFVIIQKEGGASGGSYLLIHFLFSACFPSLLLAFHLSLFVPSFPEYPVTLLPSCIVFLTPEQALLSATAWSSSWFCWPRISPIKITSARHH
jgi:hypothetical protein